MSINNQLRNSASPAELATDAKTVEASREPFSVLTINGGSSSIRFALYAEGELLRRLLDGKVDRIGLSGTNLTVRDSTGKPQDSRTIDLADHRSAVNFLLDWLETQPVFASIKAVGHRVVAKWRAVLAVGDGIPSRGCIEAKAQALARYAALCQEAGLVPVVEPEVLLDGAQTLAQCFEVTEEVLRTVIHQLYTQRVMLEGMLLKPNMMLPGLACPQQATVDEVADATVRCLLRAVPAAVPGIAFLSGGQSGELASARLNAMHVRFKSRLPWALSFSFARAIQQPALEIWQGKEANVKAAQQALLHRAKCNRAARRGEYDAAMEGTWP